MNSNESENKFTLTVLLLLAVRRTCADDVRRARDRSITERFASYLSPVYYTLHLPTLANSSQFV